MSLSARLDGLPLSRFHWWMVAVSGIGWALNSLNTNIISFVFPLVVAEWKLTPQEVGLVGTAQILGISIGAGAAGGLSDRYGRKNLFELTLAILCIATGLAGLTWDFWSLMLLRLIAGFGMGGMLPVVTTLVSEFSPSRHRGLLIVTLDSFWAWGSVIAALLAFALILVWGWRPTLFLGAVPVLYLIVLHRAGLESPRYLLGRGRRPDAESIVQQVEARCGVASPAAALDGGVVKDVAPRPRVTLAEMWSSRLRRTTACCWLMSFSMSFCYYGIFLWLPTLLVAAGNDVAKSLEFTLIINLAQLPSYAVAALLVEKTGRRWTLISSFFLYAVVVFMLGRSTNGSEIVFWGCLIAFFNSAVFAVVWTYIPESYPTRLRGTGAGWATSFGRLGAVIAPAAVGALLGNWSGNFGLTFGMFSVILLVGAASIALLGVETKGRSLEDIAT